MYKNLFDHLPSKNSRRAYTLAWGRYLAWLEAQSLPLPDVKPRDILRHLSDLRAQGKTGSTISHALSVIREGHSILVRDEVLPTNPAREVKKPKLDMAPKTPWLTEDQLKQLCSLPAKTWTEHRDRLCLHLLIGLGWRRTEIARLKVSDFKHGTVTGIVKGGKPITVGVPTWLQKEIEAWCQYASLRGDGYLLPRAPDNPRPISGDIVYQVVKEMAVRTSVPVELVTPHALRRTAITLEGARGVSLKERQLSVGHTSQNTTERYDRARDAANNAPGNVLVDLVGVEEK